MKMEVVTPDQIREYKHVFYVQGEPTFLPTPGDPTNITLSTEDTSASPVSANLAIKF